MKSLPKIAGEIGVPIATLRYRLVAYGDFIPYETTSKGREYSTETEGIIREINTLTTQGKSQEEIILILSSKYIKDIEIINEPTETTTTSQQPQYAELIKLNNNLELLIEKLDRQEEMRRDMQEMRTAIQELSRVDRHKKSWFSKLWG